ncbi:MAG TPA: GNAT family N-acetyltransferase [Candidatus Tumulicola sp.]
MTVRPGLDGDWPFVEDLGRRTASSSLSPLRPAPERLVAASFEALIDTVRSQSHALLIADRNGTACGFLILLDELPDDVTAMPQAFVAYMAVEPSARRCGAGAALLSSAEREAKQRGLPYIALMVTEDNAAARALYAGSGYATERRLLSKRL